MCRDALQLRIQGFVCLRGFDQKTKATHPLVERLHIPASKLAKAKGSNINKEQKQSRAIKLALAFDGFEPTLVGQDPQESQKGLGHHVPVAYTRPVEPEPELTVQLVGVEELGAGVEEDSSQLTTPASLELASLELAYALAQVALETFYRSSYEALEKAKETKKKLNDNDNFKSEKAALEGKDAEAQKKLEEVSLSVPKLLLLGKKLWLP